MRPSVSTLRPPLALDTIPPAIAIGALAAWLALVAPAALHAQHAEVSVFTAWNPGIGDGMQMYGGSLGGGGMGMGMRLGGAMRVGPAADDVVTGASGDRPYGFVVDMDLTYDTRDNVMLAPLASALLGFSPSVFVGAGAMAARDEAAGLRAVPAFSYGGGMSRTLIGGLAVTTEARYRALVRGADGSLPEGFRPGWEARAGLALRFGGSRASRVPGMPRIPFPLPGGGTTMGTARGSAVVDTGDDFLGVPYKYGGTTPRGFDCSGFVQYVFDRNGVRLPRTSRQQAQVGRSLATSVGALQVGDLMLFATEGSRVDHVAIYAGRNRMLHSSSSGGGVRYDDLGSSRGRWFVSKMVTARRVTDGRGNSLVDDAAMARLLREAVTSFDAPDRAPRP
jgi:hypothetical protein